MNILIIHAHENPESFSTAMMNTALAYFKGRGDKVTVSDLYQKGFNPVAGKHDFKQTSDSAYYKYALEQLHAHKTHSFQDDVREEMEALDKADVLILNFPLWWFGMPAILKGWVDRILAYGFAYGGDHGFYAAGKYKGKHAFLSISTGSPSSFYTKEGPHGRSLENILRNINEGILGLVGYGVRSPFIAYSVSHVSQEAREEMLEGYIRFLTDNFE